MPVMGLVHSASCQKFYLSRTSRKWKGNSWGNRFGECIVASADGNLLVYSFDGKLLHRIDAPNDNERIGSVTVGQQKVFFTSSVSNDSISFLDLTTGAVRKES